MQKFAEHEEWQKLEHHLLILNNLELTAEWIDAALMLTHALKGRLWATNQEIKEDQSAIIEQTLLLLKYGEVKNADIDGLRKMLNECLPTNFGKNNNVNLKNWLQGFERPMLELAKKLHVNTKIIFNCDEFEVDRALFEKLVPAIAHIMRNAICHGVDRVKGGVILISGHANGESIVIEIVDEGKKDQQKNKSQDSLLIHGLGFGLKIAEKYLTEIGGRLESMQEKKGGSKWRVLIPHKKAKFAA